MIGCYAPWNSDSTAHDILVHVPPSASIASVLPTDELNCNQPHTEKKDGTKLALQKYSGLQCTVVQQQ